MAEVLVPRRLSAKFTDDFAYPTIKDRIPVIVSKIVDLTYRTRREVKEIYGDTAGADLKMVAGLLSKLRNEVQTDKVLLPLKDQWRDVAVWNEMLQAESAAATQPPSWFTSSWLYTECYFYRRVYETFQLCTVLKMFDPFLTQKNTSFTHSLPAVNSLAEFLIDAVSTNPKKLSTEELFHIFFQVSLWGNKCDLSISMGNENHQILDPVLSLNQLRKFILLDHSAQVWQLLTRLKADKPAGTARLCVVLDNAGFELFTDLCLVEFLLSTNLISEVILYPKAMPWFVSDVTLADLNWTLTQMVEARNDSLAALGKQLTQRVEAGVIKFEVHDFWTYPHEYSKMKAVAPELYSKLAQADLILFKGDLNYRKLTQDRKWEPTTTFVHALGGFQPAPLCALRTLKADIVVGLAAGQANATCEKDSDWMVTGKYAVLQASLK